MFFALCYGVYLQNADNKSQSTGKDLSIDSKTLQEGHESHKSRQRGWNKSIESKLNVPYYNVCMFKWCFYWYLHISWKDFVWAILPKHFSENDNDSKLHFLRVCVIFLV